MLRSNSVLKFCRKQNKTMVEIIYDLIDPMQLFFGKKIFSKQKTFFSVVQIVSHTNFWYINRLTTLLIWHKYRMICSISNMKRQPTLDIRVYCCCRCCCYWLLWLSCSASFGCVPNQCSLYANQVCQDRHSFNWNKRVSRRTDSIVSTTVS